MYLQLAPDFTAKGAVTLSIFPLTFSEFVVDFPKKSTSFRTLVVTRILLHTMVVVVKTCKQTTSVVTSKSVKTNARSPRCKQTIKVDGSGGLNSIAIVFKIRDDDTRKSSSKHEKSTSNSKVDGKFCSVTAP